MTDQWQTTHHTTYTEKQPGAVTSADLTGDLLTGNSDCQDDICRTGLTKPTEWVLEPSVLPTIRNHARTKAKVLYNKHASFHKQGKPTPKTSADYVCIMQGQEATTQTKDGSCQPVLAADH